MSRHPMPDGVATGIVALYLEGWSIREIAAEVGYSYGGVRNVLVGSKTPLRPQGRYRRDFRERMGA